MHWYSADLYIAVCTVCVLYFPDAGKSFGEIALLSEDAVRNASVVTDQDTDLLVIDRELFNGTLKVKRSGSVVCLL